MGIRAIYTEEPSFPATEQHPNAVRYQIDEYWVDAIGNPPSAEDVEAVLSPAPVDTPTVTALETFLDALDASVAFDAEQKALISAGFVGVVDALRGQA